VNFSELDNALHCLFSGRLDGLVCSEIENELLQRTTNFQKESDNVEIVRVVFDLSEVIYISSAFLRLCLIQSKMFGRDRFSVTNVSEEIRKVFHISGFDEIMEIVPAGKAA